MAIESHATVNRDANIGPRWIVQDAPSWNRPEAQEQSGVDILHRSDSNIGKRCQELLMREEQIFIQMAVLVMILGCNQHDRPEE